ncbi:hypothetical protein [Phyllobacterium sp. K27]
MKLDFDTEAYKFHRGMDILKSNFELSARALASEIAHAKQKLEEYLESGEDLDQWEDLDGSGQGNLVYRHENALEFDIEAANDCAMVFRKSMIAPIYHLWERYVQSVATKPVRSHVKLVEALLEAKNHVVDFGLSRLLLLNNILKHQNREHVEILIRDCPHMFPNWNVLPEKLDWYDAVILTDVDVLDFIGIAKRSAPAWNARMIG